MAEKLKKSQLYTFGVGDLCFTLLATMELFYFSIFLTDHARFSLIIFSVILGVTGAADIICALVAGVVLQKTSLMQEEIAQPSNCLARRDIGMNTIFRGC